MPNDDGITQLGRNRFQVRVARISAKTGRRTNRKEIVVGSRADARARRDVIRSELRSTAAQRARIRLSEFAASWLEARAASLKPGTLRRYKFSLEHIVPALGDLYVDAIAPSDVSRYVARRGKAGAEGGTVLNELRCLRTMAKDSVAEGYAPRDWCDRVRAPAVRRYTKERPNRLTGAQSELVIRYVPPQWLGLTLFLITTGLRWGEASALHWEDVDLDQQEATIQWSNDRGKLVRPKNKSSWRTVPVLPEVAALWGAPKTRGLVFPGRAGKLRRGSPLLKVIRRACEIAAAKHPEAGILRVTVHGLRRTFNNEARQKVSREVLKSITGHTTDEMLGHYSHVEGHEKLSASGAVASAIGVRKVSRPQEAN